LIAPDSSVLIPALASFHTAHEPSLAALSLEKPRLIAHVAFETVSVLTRMPDGQRVDSATAMAALERTFPEPWLALDATRQRSCLKRACAAGIRGGALYDALIAATALRHGVTLISADRRAGSSYEGMGASVSFLGD
jgi:predicted nucleic acid-binding protein